MTEDASALPTDRPSRFALNMRWRLASEAIWFVLALLLAIVLAVITLAANPGIGARFGGMVLPRVLPLMLILPATVLVMAAGGLDLSVGAVATLTMFVTATMVTDGSPLLVGMLVGLVVALGVGILNGLLTGLARINGVIVTLGMTVLLQGVVRSGGSQPLTVIEATEVFSGGAGSVVFWLIAILAIIVSALLLYLTPFGRRPQPADPQTESTLARAFFTGTPYVFSALLAGFAGLALLGLLGTFFPTAGEALLADVLLAVLVGGTAFGMGYGNVIAGIPGVFASVLLNTLMTLVQVRSDSPLLYLRGVLILLAALLAHLYAYGARRMYERRGAGPEPAAAEPVDS